MSDSRQHSFLRRVYRKFRAALSGSVGPSLPSAKMPYDALLNEHGVLVGTKHLDPVTKRGHTLYFAYRERAEIALHVAYAYPGGDYFEFGCDGMGTFRSFLSAFDLNELSQRFPDTRFYGFDIFGDLGLARSDAKPGDAAYFQGYEDSDKYQQMKNFVIQHDLYPEKCILVKGYFENTLDAAFKRQLKEEKRTIGFAFLDCNITSSYVICLEFILDYLKLGSFIYMDEYFMNKEVPELFERYGASLRERQLRPLYVRNAGVFGALFVLIKA